MVLSFEILYLNINQSYFSGKVEFRGDSFTINVQDQRRGKVLKLPFRFSPKRERLMVRFSGQEDLFVEDMLPYCGESEWLEIDSDEITFFLADHQDRFDTIEIIDD